MKKYFYLLMTVILFISCTEDVKFNNPAFQGLKDNSFWRAQSYNAYTTTNGDFIIESALGFEKVTFKMPYPTQKTYILGIDNTTTVMYSNSLPAQSEQFTTGENRGSGHIIVTEFNTETKTISGTFKFKAINEDKGNLEKPEINFTEGVFYKIPVNITANY
ncbi:DUF6252 family protein [[Flexibacter] sp. ATCC 35103]|uniref:DUF6252 family protein n=1 Tax=[Flexibacter] sp. ATCC 35103 TaxID=1937528 RepID=UPI0009C9BC59|nr:DUF6252 family protein [[Flexibacter] sp. ATCC 35103]OMQ08522.1 hypothetical protein BXU01_21460 [[Flexibacter] sp. ATCC 35103]